MLNFFYYDHSEIVTESGIGKRRIRNRRCTFLIFGFHGSENENIQSGDACQKGKYRKGNDICDTGEGKSMGKKSKIIYSVWQQCMLDSHNYDKLQVQMRQLKH